MALYSGNGNTHFTVRELLQPRGTYQILSSSRLYSGTTTSLIYDTRIFKACQVYGNISQLSGTGACQLSYEMQGSVYGDDNWWSLASGVQRTATGRWINRLPQGVDLEASGIITNYTRFNITTTASNNGGIWSQMDAIFVK